jgi:indolepyruvate ferredoxin oxidoreductase beta subunit
MCSIMSCKSDKGEEMKEFNVIIAGVGGQGVITLQNIISESAMLQGYDVKTSELHGLAQRGGGVSSHIRFGNKIYSPLVLQGGANLVFALEPLEALRVCYYASKENKTVFLVNSSRITPLSVTALKERYPSNKEIEKMLKEFSSKVIFMDAADAVKKETGDTVTANIFMLGYAVKNLLPLKKEILLKGTKAVVPEKHFEMNKKVFEMGYSKA